MIKQVKRWIICLLAVSFSVTLVPLPQGVAAQADAPAVAWPGEETIVVYDTESVCYGNASGLDFHNGRLYAVDNGGGFLWVLEAFPDGTLRPADGYQLGRALQYASHDSDNGPDVEGITVDGDGLVYLAVERDNDTPWQTANTILQIDPWDGADPIKAMRQWELTELLPYAPANKGIEAVEWVSAEHIQGKLTDEKTGLPLDMAAYPDAVGNGLFFLVLEADDQVYACILRGDGSAVRIACLDPGLHGASALEFDVAECALWVASDDRGANEAVKILFSQEKTEWVRLLPPAELDPRQNTEGFAIAEESFTRDDRRPVYRLRDGVYDGALTVGFLDWHIHEFPESWMTDPQQHWHICRCGETADRQDHVYVYAAVETAKKENAGRKVVTVFHPSCSTCGYVDTARSFCIGQELFPEVADTAVARQLYGFPCV